MNDERLIRELRALDRPVSPDPAFGGALLAVLEDEYARRGRWSLIPALPGWHLGRRTLLVLAVRLGKAIPRRADGGAGPGPGGSA